MEDGTLRGRLALGIESFGVSPGFGETSGEFEDSITRARKCVALLSEEHIVVL